TACSTRTSPVLRGGAPPFCSAFGGRGYGETATCCRVNVGLPVALLICHRVREFPLGNLELTRYSTCGAPNVWQGWRVNAIELLAFFMRTKSKYGAGPPE